MPTFSPVGRVDRARPAAVWLASLTAILICAHPAHAACPNSPIFSSSTGGTNGWMLQNATTVTLPGSQWVINPGTDPMVLGPTGMTCAASSFNYMRMGMTNHGTNTSGRVYFDNGSGFAEARSVGFTNPTNPSRMPWITVRLDNISGWTGTISQLRVDPVVNGSGGTDNVDLGYFFWRSDQDDPYFRFVTVTPSDWTNGAIQLVMAGQDPPPVGHSGGPDSYGSGCTGFNLRFDATGSYAFYPRDFFDDYDGRAARTLTFNPGDLTAGSHQVDIRPVDAVGHVNVSGTQTYYLKYDPVAPNTPTVLSVSPQGWASTAQFTFTWSNPGDGLSGVDHYEARVDNGAPDVVYGETTDIFVVGNPGSHTFYVRAVDGAGNVGSWSAGMPFSSDVSGPAAPPGLTVSPAVFTNTNSFAFSWQAATDDYSGVAGYEYRFNFTDPVLPAPGLSLSNIQAPRVGSSRLEVRAYDVAGNRGAWAGVDCFYYPDWLFPPAIQAPANGATLSLPETFSWTAVAHATGYEIQISKDPNFATLAWTTSTANVTSVLVPATAAQDIGSGYAWRVRALGSDPPGNWSDTTTFIRVEGVSAPSSPALTAPADGAISAQPLILFQWSAVAGATAYRLEVSTASDFSSGAEIHWSGDNLTGTSKAVQFGSANADLFWRVTARNSAGLGSPSPTRIVHLDAAQAGVVSSAIVTPSSDVTVDEGQPLTATGLVVGRSTGTVQVDWFLDGELLSSSFLALSGTGAETEPIPIPTSVIGPHSLNLRVVDGDTVLSPPRSITVATAGFGPADHFVLVPAMPQLLTGESTALYCTVRDADGALVLADNGRPLHFDAANNGQVTPTDMTTSGGVATINYVAPQIETSPQVTVTDMSASAGFRAAAAPLPPNSYQLGVSTTELKRQQQLARDYLTRLGNLSWVGIPDVGATPGSWAPIPFKNLTRIVDWVNSRQVGDLPRLRRLNLFLRYLNRAYFYDEGVAPVGIRDPGPIPGAATLWSDCANGLGGSASAVLSLAWKLGQLQISLPIWNPFNGVIKTLAKSLIAATDVAINLAINLLRGSDYEKALMRDTWTVVKAILQSAFANPSSSIDYIVLHSGVTNHFAQNRLDALFTRPLQIQLDRVFDTISNPGWTGGSDTRAEQAVQNGLAEIRVKSTYYHRSHQATSGAFKKVQFVSDAEDIVAAAPPLKAFKVGVLLNKLIQAAILWASGTDCATIAVRIAGQGTQVANEIIAFQGPERTVAARLIPLQPLKALPGVRMASPEPFVLTAGHVEALDAAAESMLSYESAARDLETALEAADTTAVRAALTTLETTEAWIRDGARDASSPMMATASEAWLTVGGFAANTDSLVGDAGEAATLRLTATSGAWQWLADTNDDSARQSALADLRASIEATNGSLTQLVDYTPQLIGVDAVPYLSVDAPHGPSIMVLGRSGQIDVTVRNMGAGAAVNTGLVLTAPDGFSIEDGPNRLLGDIPAGESRTASWTLTANPVIPDSEDVIVGFLNVAPDSQSALGNSQSSLISVYRTEPLGTAPTPRAFALALRAPIPNPSRSSVDLRYSLPAPSPVSIDVIDVTGRRVQEVRIARREPGEYVYRWNGRDQAGNQAPAGIYFVRLSTIHGNRVTRLVRLH